MTKPPRVHVTDHAVLRHIERVLGWDVERLRNQIGHRVSRSFVPGANTVVLDGHRYVTRNGRNGEGPVVVTVLDKDRFATDDPDGTQP